ncbi:MAG: protein-S-isoprenylcysteine O-methyltransferase [Pseudomonadota bacterium]
MLLYWSIFDIVYFLGIFVGTPLIRWPHNKVHQTTDSVKKNADTLENALLGLVFIGGMIVPALYLFTPLLNFANYELPLTAGIVGTLLLPLFWWIFWRSHHDLGRQWSPTLEIRDSHRLVTVGIYQYIRHPMYTAIYLSTLCQLLLLGNWLAGPSYLVAFTIMYVLRVRKEEAFMREQFGEDYSQYMTKTGRLAPRLPLK